MSLEPIYQAVLDGDAKGAVDIGRRVRTGRQLEHHRRQPQSGDGLAGGRALLG